MLPGVASEGIDVKWSGSFATLDRAHCNAADGIVNGAKKTACGNPQAVLHRSFTVKASKR